MRKLLVVEWWICRPRLLSGWAHLDLAAGGGLWHWASSGRLGRRFSSRGGRLVVFEAALGRCGRLLEVAFSVAMEFGTALGGLQWWSRSLGCRGRRRVHAW
jgi:hypothetical protein